MRWIAGALALLVAGTLLAGCSRPPAEEEPSPTQAPERERLSRPGRGSDRDGDGAGDDEDWDDNATVLSFAEGFDLTVTSATAIIGFGSFDGNNCVSVEGTPFRILGGNATVTWAAQTPAAEELTFTTSQWYGDYYYDQQAGTSPLEVDIPDLPAAEDDSWFVFSVDAGQVGVAYEQAVHLSLAFEYEAIEEVSVGAVC